MSGEMSLSETIRVTVTVADNIIAPKPFPFMGQPNNFSGKIMDKLDRGE